eukprot:TRINITY_DN15366_c0_g1_i1.p1 TRINITY_DN15366_c0_g1~~TRINITY_DN15366_c0_g1_i1.p1  ORF type:complete len:145 (+),score=41.70 TRINITY_DN15366_c0_g1_i1:84-518(+)
MKLLVTIVQLVSVVGSSCTGETVRSVSLLQTSGGAAASREDAGSKNPASVKAHEALQSLLQSSKASGVLWADPESEEGWLGIALKQIGAAVLVSACCICAVALKLRLLEKETFKEALMSASMGQGAVMLAAAAIFVLSTFTTVE